MFKLTKNKIIAISSKLNNLNTSYNKLFSKTFLSGTNSRYIEEMYKSWTKDPNSVHISWKTYFDNVSKGNDPNSAFAIPPTIDPSVNYNLNAGLSSNSTINLEKIARDEQTKLTQLIRSYQKQGYLKANLDPLGLMSKQSETFPIFKNSKDLSHKSAGFTDEDLEKEFFLPENQVKLGLLGSNTEKKIKLKDLIAKLEKSYCGDIGVEFTHISSREERNFIIDAMENRWLNYNLTKEEKINTYKRLAKATKLEAFLELKFMTKRFGVEGLETTITGLNTYFEEASKNGVVDITLGMAHRGRLNVLANVFGKPIVKIFKEIMEKEKDSQGNEYERTGDVKYHLGHSQTKLMESGKQLTMKILPNPSHLECVNPVVQGKVRAKQHFNKDDTREQ